MTLTTTHPDAPTPAGPTSVSPGTASPGTAPHTKQNPLRLLAGGHDGVRFRPAVPADEPAIADLFERVGPDARFRRFHGWPSAAAVRREVQRAANATDRYRSWVAADRDGTVWSVVSLGRDLDGTYEVAALADDAVAGAGLTRRLLALAFADAQQAGAARVVARVQSDNWRALRLFRSLPNARARAEDGAVRIDAPLGATTTPATATPETAPPTIPQQHSVDVTNSRVLARYLVTSTKVG